MSKWLSLVQGVVLIIATVRADALSEGMSLMNDPMSEKIVYPLPPGVTPLTLSKETTILKPHDAASITESSTSTEEIMYKKPSAITESQPSEGSLPNEVTFMNDPITEKIVYPLPPGVSKETIVSGSKDPISKKPSEIIESQPSTEGSPIGHLKPSKEETPSKESTPPTEGPIFTEPIHFKISDEVPHTEATSNPETTPSATIEPSIKDTTLPAQVSEATLNLKACTTPFGKQGECKNIHHCPSLLKLIKREPLLAENILYLQRSQCGFENKTVLGCCPDNVPEPIISPKWSLLPKPGKCGTMTENRLYGGYATEIDSYRWLALLQYSKGGKEAGFHCGGALINNRYILTAAHCVSNLPETWSLKSVRLGEWDIATNMDCSKFNDFIDCADPHIDFGIEEIIPHKDYVPTSNNRLHDIALIRLTNGVNRTDFIEPICLPHGENNLHGFDDQSLDVAGWGASPEGLWSNVKERASAPVIPLNNCRSKFAERNITLEPSQFCVEGRIQNDTCRLDSGGPVISFDTSNKGLGSYYVAGIQSFGPFPCWAGGLPEVYTRVGEYLDWILDNIQN